MGSANDYYTQGLANLELSAEERAAFTAREVARIREMSMHQAHTINNEQDGAPSTSQVPILDKIASAVKNTACFMATGKFPFTVPLLCKTKHTYVLATLVHRSRVAHE